MYDKNTTNKLQKENIMNNDDIFNEWTQFINEYKKIF